ncbi:MAG: anti-sigma factor family protein [Candidatus Aminicenantales bacterium]
MDCEKFSAILDSYLVGRIKAEEKKSLKEHAARCSHCRNALEVELRIKNAFDKIAESEVPAYFRQKILAQATMESRRSAPKMYLSKIFEENLISWIVPGLLLPFAVLPVCFTLLKIASSALTPLGVLALNFSISCSIVIYSLWQAYRVMKIK